MDPRLIFRFVIFCDKLGLFFFSRNKNKFSGFDDFDKKTKAKVRPVINFFFLTGQVVPVLSSPNFLLVSSFTSFRGTQRECSSKPLKHSIVKRILVFKR